MNIGLISREYPPFFGGGIGTYAAQFARAAADAGHGVVVLTVSDQGRMTRDHDAGITIVRLPFIAGDDWTGPHPAIATPDTVAAFSTFAPVSVLAMGIAEALPELIDEFALDVIETPDTGALAWFALNNRRTRPPRPGPAFVTHVHSPTRWIEEWNRAVEPGRAAAELIRMEAEAARWSDGIVCPSRAVAEWATRQWDLPADAVEVVPYPLGELETIARRSVATSPHTIRAADEPASGTRLLFVGRLEPRKGIDALLAGFALAAERGLDLHLDLVGRDAIDRRTGRPFGARSLELLVPPSLRARVTLHGLLRPDAVGRCRARAGVAVIPSPMDNYPFTCMEAMAAGIPVVAAGAGGMGEMIRDGRDGLLFAPGDPESCAEALARVAAMTPAARAELGRSAAERILTLCNNQSVIERRIAHYERVVAARRAASAARAATPTGLNPSVVVVSRGRAATNDVERLLETVRVSPDISFAHGWVRLPGEGSGPDATMPRTLVYGTPSLESLLTTPNPRLLGPLVVRADAAMHPRVRPTCPGVAGALLAAPDALTVEARYADAWALALALQAAGFAGAVVPDVVTEIDPLPLAPSLSDHDLAHLCVTLGPRLIAGGLAGGAGVQPIANADAEAELAKIYISRGWRLLQRIYAILHVLKGRARTGRR